MRPGLTLRIVGERSFYEVACAGELERVRGALSSAQYDAALELRRLWHDGTLAPGPTASCLASLEAGTSRSADVPDRRLEANDRLRRLLRSMAGCADHVVDVCCYDRRADLHTLQKGLQRAVASCRQGGGVVCAS